MQLVKRIDASYETELREYRKECYEIDKSYTPFILNIDFPNFIDFQNILLGFSEGIGITPDFVPHTTYWLIDQKRIIGVSSLRHQLTDNLKIIGGHIGYGIRPSERKKGYGTKILALTIIEGKKLGIKEFLLTCDKDNKASVNTILNNNGVLISEDIIDNTPIQRYIIKI